MTMIPTFVNSSSPQTVVRKVSEDDLEELTKSLQLPATKNKTQHLIELSSLYLERFCNKESEFNEQETYWSFPQDNSSSSCDEAEAQSAAFEETSPSAVVVIEHKNDTLKSCLVKTNSPRRGRAAVRGLWKEPNDCNTSILSDNLLTNIFAFLGMEDLVSCEAVSQRWEAVASQPDLWRTTDASIFVQQTFKETLLSSVQTTRRLTEVLQCHDIENLTLMDVGNSLSADFLHLPLTRLRRITIGQFDGLSDTHIRSLFFLASLRSPSLPLISCRFTECKSLTSKCLSAIRTLCPKALCSMEEQHALQQHLVLQTISPQTTPLTSLFVGK